METKTKIIANANAKGGVGKTTNTLGLCYALSHDLGFDVLLVDGDPQASATSDLGVEDTLVEKLTLDELVTPLITINLSKFRTAGYQSPIEYWEGEKAKYYTWENVKRYIVHPTYLGLERDEENGMKWKEVRLPYGGSHKFDLLPCSINFSLCDTLMGIASSNFQGKVYDGYVYDALSPILKANEYDFIVIDLPPQLSSISINLLTAAVDGIILDSNLDLQSIKGFDTITTVADQITAKYSAHRGILGILFSMYSSARKVDKKIEEIAKEYVPIPVFDTKIPESTDAKKAILQGRLYNQLNKKAQKAFEDFAKEIVYAMRYPDAPIGSNKEAK